MKDYFLELGFAVQEEHPATRTDLCITHPPIEVAIECKNVSVGVTPEHVQRFDERLKVWQNLGRPCLGAMVANSFQEEAKRLADDKNILCILDQQIEDALRIRRESDSSHMIPVLDETTGLVRAMAGLMTAWLPHIFGDAVEPDSPFLPQILGLGYAEPIAELAGGMMVLRYTDLGREFFRQCGFLFAVLRDTSDPYTSEDEISTSIQSAIEAQERRMGSSYDVAVATGMGLLAHDHDGLRKSQFAERLLRIVADSGTS
jgi:hypothetical protein